MSRVGKHSFPAPRIPKPGGGPGSAFAPLLLLFALAGITLAVITGPVIATSNVNLPAVPGLSVPHAGYNPIGAHDPSPVLVHGHAINGASP